MPDCSIDRLLLCLTYSRPWLRSLGSLNCAHLVGPQRWIVEWSPLPCPFFYTGNRRRIETGSRQIAYDADWPGRIARPWLASESKQAKPGQQKKPWDAGAYGRGAAMAKRFAQSEWRVQWAYHAFTLLRKLDDDGPEPTQRKREKVRVEG